MSSHHLIALLLALHVALSDLRTRRVSNRALVVALCAGSLGLVAPWGSQVPSAALLGVMAGLVALLPFYCIGWMGAGDVKFFALLGFLLGWRALLPIWIIASLLAGVHALAILSSRWVRTWIPAGHAGPRTKWTPHSPSPDDAASTTTPRTSWTPYAACLSVGTALVLLAPEGVAHA